MGRFTLSMVLVADNGERYEIGRVNLSEADIAILVDLIRHGDNTPSNIAQNVDKSRVHVQNRISDLEEEGLTMNKGGGVWTLTPDGAELAAALRGSWDSVRGSDEND